MKTIPLRFSIALLIQFVLVALYLFIFFNGCGNEPAIPKVKIIAPEVLSKQVTESETLYQKKFNQLEKTYHELEVELSTIKKQLAPVKAKTKKQETRIKKLIAPLGYPAKDLLKKVNPSAIALDSSLTDCQSLVTELSDYLIQAQTKDSLFEEELSSLEAMLTVKDSIIGKRIEVYERLQYSFQQSVEQQEQLIKENTRLSKAHKRQKLKNKLLTIGVAIISALGVHSLIQQ